ncbi:MAG: hypothetical protein R2788_02920 [Saprospiraceae bacterium]
MQNLGDEITVQGDNLDLATAVVFSGGIGTHQQCNSNATTVDLPIGAVTGHNAVITTNSSQIGIYPSTSNILLATNAIITNVPTMAARRNDQYCGRKPQRIEW